MKRDEIYFAREDIALNRWIDARREELARLPNAEAVRDLVRSAFRSGVRFGSEEAEIQAVVAERRKAQ